MEPIFNQHVGIYENVIPPKVCSSIIELFEQNFDKTIDRHEEAKNIILRENENYKFKKNESLIPFGFREDRHLFLNHINLDLTEKIKTFLLKEIFPSYVKKYMDPSKYKKLIIKDVKIQKTLPSEGYHVWHTEHSDSYLELSSRVVAYTVYLNDVEEGGETEFLHQSLRVKPTQGSICLFPCYFTHPHRGNPPLTGAKYILTGWIQTEPPTK